MRVRRWLCATLAACVVAASSPISHAALQDAAQLSAPAAPTATPAPQSPATPDDKLCTIAGNVLSANTGEPLRHARIQLMDREAHEPTPYQASTDGAGHFTLEKIPAGHYDLKVHHDGYRDTSYGQMNPSQGEAVLTLTPGQKMTDLLFRLTKLAAVSGRVVDPDGDPVEQASVTMVSKGKPNSASTYSAQTNDRGEYRIYGIVPGRYVLAAEPADANGVFMIGARMLPPEYQRAYYPGTPDAARASTFDVKSGDDLTGMDVTLIPRSGVHGYKIRGRVIDNTNARGDPVEIVQLAPRGTPIVNFGDQRIAQPDATTGAFELDDVAPGDYSIAAMREGSGQRYQVDQNITVVEADLENVTLVLTRGADMAARVTLEGKGARSATWVRPYLTPPPDAVTLWGSGPLAAEKQNDGAYLWTGVKDGAFTLDVGSDCATCYVKAAEANGVDLLARGVQVNEGVGPARIDIIYSSESGTVTGSVTNKDDLPAVGVTVVLIPSSPVRAQRREYHTAQTDQYGRFEAKGLAPGDYSAYALEQVDSELFNETDPMRSYAGKGESVSVAANGRQSVDLKVIPASDAAN